MKNEMVVRAIQIADLHHAEQKWGIFPYIIHLDRVVQTLIQHGFTTPKYIAAGWLHDVLEDTDLTEDDLLKEFPTEVVDIVVAVSDPPGLTRRHAKPLVNHQIQQHYYPPAAIPVKVANRLVNVSGAIQIKRDDDLLQMYAKEHQDFRLAVFLGLSWGVLHDHEFDGVAEMMRKLNSIFTNVKNKKERPEGNPVA